MTSKLDVFLKDVKSATAKADTADAGGREVEDALSAEDFARLPAIALSHLSERQYREIVHSIAPTVTLKREPALVRPTDKHEHKSLGNWIHGRRSRRALIVAGSSGSDRCCRRRANVGMVVIWKPLVRSASCRGMAALSHLTSWTDGCVYRVVKGLDWAKPPTISRFPRAICGS